MLQTACLITILKYQDCWRPMSPNTEMLKCAFVYMTFGLISTVTKQQLKHRSCQIFSQQPKAHRLWTERGDYKSRQHRACWHDNFGLCLYLIIIKVPVKRILIFIFFVCICFLKSDVLLLSLPIWQYMAIQPPKSSFENLNNFILFINY